MRPGRRRIAIASPRPRSEQASSIRKNATVSRPQKGRHGFDSRRGAFRLFRGRPFWAPRGRFGPKAFRRGEAPGSCSDAGRPDPADPDAAGAADDRRAGRSDLGKRGRDILCLLSRHGRACRRRSRLSGLDADDDDGGRRNRKRRRLLRREGGRRRPPRGRGRPRLSRGADRGRLRARFLDRRSQPRRPALPRSRRIRSGARRGLALLALHLSRRPADLDRQSPVGCAARNRQRPGPCARHPDRRSHTCPAVSRIHFRPRPFSRIRRCGRRDRRDTLLLRRGDRDDPLLAQRPFGIAAHPDPAALGPRPRHPPRRRLVLGQCAAAQPHGPSGDRGCRSISASTRLAATEPPRGSTTS